MRLLLPLLLLAGCAAPPASPPVPPVPATPDPFVALLDQLRSDEIEARDRAERALLAMGPGAEARLRRALEGADTDEIRARLAAVLDRLEISNMPLLPQEGMLGGVRIHVLHAFAWQTQPRAEHTFVSTVWEFENTGSTVSTVRILRARVVLGGLPRDVRITGTKLDPDPAYPLEPGQRWRPALKMPEGPAAPAGAAVFAVLDFSDGAGHELKLRSSDAGVEKTE